MLIVAVALMSVLQVNAQTTTVADKEILGAWTMEWMHSCIIRCTVYFVS